MRNILLLMDYAAPYKGNFIPSVLNLEEKLRLHGVKTIFVFPDVAQKLLWNRELILKNKAVYFVDRVFFSKRIKIKQIRYLSAIIKKEDVGLIHTHFVSHNFNLYFGKLLFFRKIKVIGNFMNEYILPRTISRGLKLFTTKRLYDKIIASSNGVFDSLKKIGVSENKLVCIYNALDTNHLEINSDFTFGNLNPSDIVLMFGRPYHRKGVDIAIKAMAIVVKHRPQTKLVLAIAGEKEKLINDIINDFDNVPDYVKIFGPNDKVAEYYNASTVFVSASREEGFTYSVLEASYCKPLPIVSRIPGHPLDISHIEIFEYEDYKKLAVGILKLISFSSKEKEQINEKQKQYVKNRYSVDDWSANIIEIINSIL